MNKIKSILFVCTGNSCRSVMAEGLARKYLKELGKSYISVSSAGSSAIDGLSPTQETVNVMKDEGLDVSAFRSKRLTAELIKNSDLILVMENFHREAVLDLSPESGDKTYLLTEFGLWGGKRDGRPGGVNDPIGQPVDRYKETFESIKESIERLIKILI